MTGSPLSISCPNGSQQVSRHHQWSLLSVQAKSGGQTLLSQGHARCQWWCKVKLNHSDELWLQ